jgi:hypothetical protein
MTLTKISMALSADDADDMTLTIHLGCDGGYEICDVDGDPMSTTKAFDIIDDVLMELEPIYNDLLDSPR